MVRGLVDNTLLRIHILSLDLSLCMMMILMEMSRMSVDLKNGELLGFLIPKPVPLVEKVARAICDAVIGGQGPSGTRIGCPRRRGLEQ